MGLANPLTLLWRSEAGCITEAARFVLCPMVRRGRTGWSCTAQRTTPHRTRLLRLGSAPTIASGRSRPLPSCAAVELRPVARDAQISMRRTVSPSCYSRMPRPWALGSLIMRAPKGLSGLGLWARCCSSTAQRWRSERARYRYLRRLPHRLPKHPVRLVLPPFPCHTART